MENINKEKYQDLGLLIFRITVSCFMIGNHGLPKLLRLFGNEPITFYPFLGLSPNISLSLAVFAEFICAIAVIVGFYTRFASVFLFVTMFVAAFVVNVGKPFSDRELALLYMVSYLTLIFTDARRYSLNEFLKKVGRSAKI